MRKQSFGKSQAVRKQDKGDERWNRKNINEIRQEKILTLCR
jgi:hypothetical protein